MKRAKRPLVFVVTCEHGGNRVPARYRRWFRGRARILATHRGYDPGALDVARTLAQTLDAPLIAATVSRLVIELNRSPTHPVLFSPMMHGAPADVRAEAFERHYLPYRTELELFVADSVARGSCVVHVSSHSFTPVLDGVVRAADIGLLYDPARPLELALCDTWQRELAAYLTDWRVRRNYPYRGTGDGLTTYLRRRFDDDVYVGIELEVNQKHVGGSRAAWATTRASVAASLASALGKWGQVQFPTKRRERALQSAAN
jgi:predicted N-formylglutamate amidohydrolase